MTQDELARSYLTMARQRQRTLGLLLEEEAHSVVVRESQAIVELALKDPDGLAFALLGNGTRRLGPRLGQPERPIRRGGAVAALPRFLLAHP